RAVAGRTGQPRSGAISLDPDRRVVRHRLRRISLARRGTRKADRHRPGLLNSAASVGSTGAASKAAPVLFCLKSIEKHAGGISRRINRASVPIQSDLIMM